MIYIVQMIGLLLISNCLAFDLDDHFFSYSQFFSSDSILRLQGLGSHTFDLYTVEASETIKIGVLEFGYGMDSNYEFSEYSQKFNDNSFAVTEDGFLSLNRFRNRSGCEDIICFASTLEPETIHMQEYRQGQLISQYIPAAIEETYLLRKLLGYFQGYTFAFGTDGSSLYRADNRAFRPQESDRNTFPINNFTGKNIYKELNDGNLLMGYINNSGLNLQLSIATNLSQVEEGGSPMTSLINEGSLSGAEDFGQNDWMFFSDGSLFVLQSDHIDNTYRLVRG
jgi:hypothetical protein